MLGQFQALALIVARFPAIERGRVTRHVFIDELCDRLPVLENERHIARADFKNSARPTRIRPEARIEKAGIMGAEFTQLRRDRRHFCGLSRRHADAFARGEDVEILRVQDQPPLMREERLPIVGDFMAANGPKVDQPGMMLCAPADGFAICGLHVDGDDQVADILRLAAAKTQLGEPVTGAGKDGIGAGADFQPERAVIALLNIVERIRAVSDESGENIDPPGGAFGVCAPRNTRGEAYRFHERDEIDAACFQHSAGIGQRDFMQRQARLFQHVADPTAVPRQEARPDAIGDGAEPKVEAGRLDLIDVQRLVSADRAFLEQLFQFPVGQDALSWLNHALILFRQEA